MARQDFATQIDSGAGSTAEGFYQLGLMYASGRDVPRDYVEAHKWFNIAAFRGLKEAAERRCELASEMSAAEIAEAQRQARDWLSGARLH